jgi:hypothetical protein
MAGQATAPGRDRLGLLVSSLPPDHPAPEKPIATAGRSFQQFPIRPERLANRGYVDLERILRYNSARPHATHEVVLGDEFAGRLNENLNDLERTAANGNRDPARAQLAPGEVDLPTPGFAGWSLALWSHRLPFAYC